jgi:hypothetical protein
LWQWYQGCPSMSHLHPSMAPRSFWSALSFDTLCSDCNTRHLQSSTSPPEGQTEFNWRHLRTKKFLPSSCKHTYVNDLSISQSQHACTNIWRSRTSSTSPVFQVSKQSISTPSATLDLHTKKNKGSQRLCFGFL